MMLVFVVAAALTGCGQGALNSEPPVGESPIVEPPAEEPSAQDPPGEEPSAEEPSAEEPSTGEPPEVASATWHNLDVGTVEVPGSVGFSDGDAVTIMAAGADIWDAADSFHFVYVPFEGDVDVRARIEKLDASHTWAKAGVMIRGGLDASAAHALMSITPGGAAEFIRRPSPGAESDSSFTYGAALPTWVRLVREERTVVASTSVDGSAWTEIDRADVGLEETVFVGIAVTSRNPEVVTAAQLRGVQVLGEQEVVIDYPGEQPNPAPPGDDPDPTPPEGDPDPSPPEDEPDPSPPVDDPVIGSEWVCPDEPLTPRFTPTLFVATNGSNGNDGRAIDRPLRTLQYAADLAGPGDVVWVREGTYAADVVFSRSGTSSQRIVFESHPGECAVLDGSGLSKDRRVGIIDASFVTFRNFVVRNAAGEGIFLSNAHDNVIANVRSHDNFFSGITSLGGDRNLFTYIIAHDNHDVGSGGDADGISISSGNGNRIQHCMVYQNSDDGVDTWRSTNTLVEYCAAFRNGYLGDGDGNGFKAGSSGYTVNTVVRHSVAFENRVNGFDHNLGNGVTFDQNTAYGNGSYGIVADGGATVRNNLSIGNGTQMWMGDVNQQRNSWNLSITSSPFVSTDPASVDFLRLREDSAPVGAGIDLGLSGGASPDLGALPLGETLSSYLGMRPDEIAD